MLEWFGETTTEPSDESGRCLMSYRYHKGFLLACSYGSYCLDRGKDPNYGTNLHNTPHECGLCSVFEV